MSTNYGRELSCTRTLKTGRYVSGVTVVAEAIYRRLTTPRGMLLGGESEGNYGLDLMSLVGSAGLFLAMDVTGPLQGLGFPLLSSA
jgi:hypothetical protein